MSATAVRGGRSAGVLEVEHAGGTALVPPPPPPPLDKEAGERCFRSRGREYRFLVKDTRTVVTPNGEPIPGERDWLLFKPHASGMFGEIVTADPKKIFVLECLAGIRCAKPEHKGRLLDECRAKKLPCRALEIEGEVWEAEGQVEEYDELRAQQMLQELKERPQLREKLRSLGDASELFQLGEPQRPARQPRKRDEKPPAGDEAGQAQGAKPEGGFDLES